MPKIDRKLRTFIRIDGDGRSIVGSDVRRFKAPRQGRWKEIVSEPCCDGTTLTATPGSTSGSSTTVTVLCDATTEITALVSEAFTDVKTLVKALNDKAGYLGVFEVAENGSDVDLVLKSTVVQDIGCTGTLSFTTS